jgi:NADH-quinone oxidoreductase subunit M
MSIWSLPWLELSIAVLLAGAVACAGIRDVKRAFHWGLACAGLALAGTALAWVSLYLRPASAERIVLPFHPDGRPMFDVDELSAPLATMVALLYFLTILATGRTKMLQFSFTGSLASEMLQLAAFGSAEPWVLIWLLAAGTVPPYFVLRGRGAPTRVYVVHMALFVGLLVLGQTMVGMAQPSGWAAVPLLAAVLVRCGTIPVHCWVTHWFEHASFGNALLFVAPLTGVYAAARLVLPVAPDWVLSSIGIVSLVTAVYAAGMATVQRDARRFFAYLFLSHASLVLVGLELQTPISLTGALWLWFSVTLALGGLGLTLRALEARFGQLSLGKFLGLYEHTPVLAISFLLTGLASVGFPGTLGFIATEMLVDGAVEANLYLGVAVVLAAALNGIAVVRAYLLLFTGARHVSTISLRVGPRERFAILTLAILILVGGLFPQPGIASRHEAAQTLLKERGQRLRDPGIGEHLERP